MDVETRRQYHRKWNAKNRLARLKINKRAVEKRRAWFAEYKTTQECLICFEKESVCLDFHHVDPTQKKREVSILVRNSSIKTILKEISKCVVLCSNCHRKVHAGIVQLVGRVPRKD